jgi:hypothetical protein
MCRSPTDRAPPTAVGRQQGERGNPKCIHLHNTQVFAVVFAELHRTRPAGFHSGNRRQHPGHRWYTEAVSSTQAMKGTGICGDMITINVTMSIHSNISSKRHRGPHWQISTTSPGERFEIPRLPLQLPLGLAGHWVSGAGTAIGGGWLTSDRATGRHYQTEPPRMRQWSTASLSIIFEDAARAPSARLERQSAHVVLAFRNKSFRAVCGGQGTTKDR